MWYSLDNYCDKKSFYGRCAVERFFNYDNLYSYGTLIMEFDRNTKKIRRLWNGYSRTTQRHINAFLRFVNRTEFIGKTNTYKMKRGEWY